MKVELEVQDLMGAFTNLDLNQMPKGHKHGRTWKGCGSQTERYDTPQKSAIHMLCSEGSFSSTDCLNLWLDDFYVKVI